MISRVSLFVIAVVLAMIVVVAQAQNDDALKNIQIGMQGVMQAAKDPEMLAQLMKDLQDPEMMAEAQKMMNDPSFKKKMKDLTGGKEFKDSVKKTTDMMEDPNLAAAAEAKFEHMQRVGNDRLKQGAASDMEQAMAALANPEVMAEMTAMLKDPAFKETLAGMAKDPQMQNYIEAMKDMVKDPAKRQKIEQVSEAVKGQL